MGNVQSCSEICLNFPPRMNCGLSIDAISSIIPAPCFICPDGGYSLLPLTIRRNIEPVWRRDWGCPEKYAIEELRRSENFDGPYGVTVNGYWPDSFSNFHVANNYSSHDIIARQFPFSDSFARLWDELIALFSELYVLLLHNHDWQRNSWDDLGRSTKCAKILVPRFWIVRIDRNLR